MAYVRSLKDQGVGLDGHTLGTCEGGWWSKDQQKWIYDSQRLITLDYLIDIDDPKNSLLAKIEELVKTIESAYRHYKCPEDEFWVASESMTRYFPPKRPQRAPRARAGVIASADD